MVHFGDKPDDIIHERVLATDDAVQALNIEGLTETIPSFTSLFVGYDPLITDYKTVVDSVIQVIGHTREREVERTTWEIPVCYDEVFAPDLDTVAFKTQMTREGVIAAHLEGLYKAYMYGFAPGYAYLGGVPETIQLPRKQEPVRNVPRGSVLIAGFQCLVTTLKMPTGWWIIGRSPFEMLQTKADNPFPVAVGDRICFQRISSREYDDYLRDGPQ